MPAVGHILFLVPSLSLLSQSLREWTAEAEHPIHSLAVCSDINIGKRREKNEDDVGDIYAYDLAFPATTNARQLVAQYQALQTRAKKDKEPPCLTVIFSTYQSIEAVSKAQKAGLPAFDLIICDEAHRTTGVTLTGEDESAFVKVHDADFLKAKKRLYMTATPRIYGDQAKTKAKELTAELASMDDESLFGKELHRLGFGEAVGKALLSDYKVLVLAVDEKYVSKTFQKQIADKSTELNLDDAVKITGCWNGLSKRFEKSASATDASGQPIDFQGDVQPMRRAVAFSRSIKDSKAFIEKTRQIVAAYKENHPDDPMLELEGNHVDGTFDALRRSALLDWLKAESPANTCRILSNAKCLSEGVDVPALDAVLFLNPRNSVIDVVQSVGRVMRRAEGKRYGYIILPVGIPADATPEEALKNNEKYKVVWQVLQARRAHDDRFNATINQLELNKNRPPNIQVIGVGGPDHDTDTDHTSPGDSKPQVRELQGVFAFPQLEEWKDAIYAKMVKKVGDRGYWVTWTQDVARIAETHITRIKALLDDPKSKQSKAFDQFLKSLQQNLNPAVSRDDAIEMLAQHLITKPVFDALFENYVFTKHNPVSISMQKMLDILHEQTLEKENKELEKFYDSVRNSVAKIDNLEGKQKVVIELYDEFFRTAFPRMAERLGIVYTPVEVVDFIIKSVEDVLRDEFKSGLAEKDVHIIDPFTGTGTFLVRLLQSGLIPADKLLHKYKHELHANEIVLLAYYIAAINIEETFHGLLSSFSTQHSEFSISSYIPFEGICLTDTFQLYESGQQQIEGTFPENTARVKRQKASPIRVVIANPPYSMGQTSENDNNKNLDYPALDGRIGETYAERSTATLKTSLYDSYIRAIRWASDRIKDKGVIGFVTNGSYIDGNAADGLRATLLEEFTSIYVFNLRGNQRTSGELSRQEGGKIFGSGSRAPIAVTLLIKNPVQKPPATLLYHDIGDYLDRNEKLRIIKGFASIAGVERAGKWTMLIPNAEHDWINQRDEAFGNFTDLSGSVFEDSFGGVKTNRDAWVYNFSSKNVQTNMASMIRFYEKERKRFNESVDGDLEARKNAVDEFIDADPKQIAWTVNLKNDLARDRKRVFNGNDVAISLYRPFTKSSWYSDKNLNERPLSARKLFPSPVMQNLVICTTGTGSQKEFSTTITNVIPDYEVVSKAQCFSRYIFDEQGEEEGKLDLGNNDDEIIDSYRRRDAITDAILKKFREAYGPKVSKEDIFYYVYGILHSPEYRTRFAADLKKMLPRIPLTKETKDFKAFSEAGRELAKWHLNYETIPPWPVEEIHDQLDLGLEETYEVKKMTFARPTPEQKAAGAKWDKTRIIYNSHITISKIPLEAYDYVVNGKPAIEWVMERYQYTRDKDSGIVNDPNDWCKEHNQPRYIIDLVARIVRVSIETMKIVNSLPPLNERHTHE